MPAFYRLCSVLLFLAPRNSLSLTPPANTLQAVIHEVQNDLADGLPDSVCLQYTIFKGESALRDTRDHPLFSLGLSSTALSIIFLLKGEAEVAHEVVLGVGPNTIEEAEYAATHPGQTDWSEKHPLSAEADLIHSIIHRFEGNAKGEGGHTGFENAKYWACGGPKRQQVIQHPLSTALVQHLADKPMLRQRLAPSTKARYHSILADGGTRRTVEVPLGCWDGLAFIDLCKECHDGKLSPNDAEDLRELVKLELMLLLERELSNSGNCD